MGFDVFVHRSSFFEAEMNNVALLAMVAIVVVRPGSIYLWFTSYITSLSFSFSFNL